MYCKMAALLGRHSRSRALLADHAPAVTSFGRRRGRLSLAIHENTRGAAGVLHRAAHAGGRARVIDRWSLS
uniref:Uncharacterized protein n=1 Tax=Aegilops tauschii subsp. strangulata TaxID=200361 RepID=A0A453DXP5_AEGTS